MCDSGDLELALSHMLDMSTLEFFHNILITKDVLNSACGSDLTMVLMTCRLGNQRLLLLAISVAYLSVLLQPSPQQEIVGIAVLNCQFSSAAM